MNKFLFPVLFLLFLSLTQAHVLSQPLYEKGYYEDNSNNIYEGYIDRTELRSSQDFINFKSSKKSTVVQLFPNQVSKVFVSGILLESHIVLIDTTAFGIAEEKAPSFAKKNLFLFNLIDSEITLLEYRAENSSLFFLQERSNQDPYQLIFKRYIGRNDLLFNNNEYRKQLDTLIYNLELNVDTEQIFYTNNSLSDLIINLNSSKNFVHKNYTNQSLLSPRYLNIAAITGFRFSRVISKETITGDELFSQEDASLSNIGVELEYLLPSFKNRLSIIGRSEFATGSTRSDMVLFASGTQQVKTNLDYLFLTLGIRGYLHIFKATKLYADAGISKPFVIGDGINIRHDIRPDFNYQKKNLTSSFGIGIAALNRFSLESRFEFINTILDKSNEFNNISYSAFTINLKVFLKSYYSIWTN